MFYALVQYLVNYGTDVEKTECLKTYLKLIKGAEGE